MIKRHRIDAGGAGGWISNRDPDSAPAIAPALPPTQEPRDVVGQRFRIDSARLRDGSHSLVIGQREGKRDLESNDSSSRYIEGTSA